VIYCKSVCMWRCNLQPLILPSYPLPKTRNLEHTHTLVLQCTLHLTWIGESCPRTNKTVDGYITSSCMNKTSDLLDTVAPFPPDRQANALSYRTYTSRTIAGDTALPCSLPHTYIRGGEGWLSAQQHPKRTRAFQLLIADYIVRVTKGW
jgi:hypothetical protein